jgi:hypothetical protein
LRKPLRIASGYTNCGSVNDPRVLREKYLENSLDRKPQWV